MAAGDEVREAGRHVGGVRLAVGGAEGGEKRARRVGGAPPRPLRRQSRQRRRGRRASSDAERPRSRRCVEGQGRGGAKGQSYRLFANSWSFKEEEIVYKYDMFVC